MPPLAVEDDDGLIITRGMEDDDICRLNRREISYSTNERFLITPFIEKTKPAVLHLVGEWKKKYPVQGLHYF